VSVCRLRRPPMDRATQLLVPDAFVVDPILPLDLVPPIIIPTRAALAEPIPSIVDVEFWASKEVCFSKCATILHRPFFLRTRLNVRQCSVHAVRTSAQ
jgi:hypothetical protein